MDKDNQDNFNWIMESIIFYNKQTLLIFLLFFFLYYNNIYNKIWII